ncbi:succinylglutamate desuccinylase/aspartoacylase family protein, partial [Klebsiella pneumoniae]|uniref:succinylglutamate desuccinylase/aspartoacylase domain-containing protein n=1 Tax=Klebsiella pneumoniae TaxID=573 RepID=UPI0039688D66
LLIQDLAQFPLHLDDDVANFTELSPGYLLAEDIGGTRWVVEEVGARIIFPNPRVKNRLWLSLLCI